MSMVVGRSNGPGDGGLRGRSAVVRWVQAAVVGLAVGLALWGALHEAAPVGPFVTVSAVGCGGTSFASGFAVADDLVVTAAHPVAGRRRVAVTDVAGRTRQGFVVALDPALDVAAVRVPGLGADPVTLAAGDDAALAPPGGTGVVASMSEGGELLAKPFEVTRRVRANIDDIYLARRVVRRALELTFGSTYGDSGAAVLNGDDVVVGMVFATSRSRTEVGYAIRSVEITEVLAEVAELPRRTSCV